MTQPAVTNAPQGEPSYFFDDGLRFECQRCGRCCTGSPGIVRFEESEAQAMSDYLGVTRDSFMTRFTHRVGAIVSLREQKDGACIFYDSGCTIYPVRPAQCRTFPFWLKNLRTPEAWSDVAKSCPGIGKGKLFRRSAILATVADSPI